MTFKPLLAYTVKDAAAVRFPVLASPKLDGIRCIIRDGCAVTRSLKPVPNVFVSALLTGLPDLDGELICGDPTAPDVFTRSTSAVMSCDGQPAVKLHVFDVPRAGVPFSERQQWAEGYAAGDSRLEAVPHALIMNRAQLDEYESQMVAAGYEGIMIRDPGGAYKFGRSTEREGILGKVKRFEDTEGRVVAVEELQHNGNAATVNALGNTERSTSKAGLTGGGVLGALVVQAEGWAEPFRIGTGFTAAQRAEYWADDLTGRLVRFKYQPSGAKDAPRFPVFTGWRGDE